MIKKALTLLVILLFINKSHAAPADDFVIVIKSDNTGSSAATEFTIPTTGSGYNYNVDCNNDGTLEATAQTGDYTCDYSSLGGPGTYTIRIKDNSGAGTGFPRIYFNFEGDRLKITSLAQWGSGIWTSMFRAFQGTSNMTVDTTDAPNLIAVELLDRMFDGAHLANPDTSNWDISGVRWMRSMFNNAASANPDTSNWNTGKVSNMQGMFSDAVSANPDTSNWVTTTVINMDFMFNNATSANPDTSNWDTANVRDMAAMFRGATSANPDTSSWNTTAVASTSLMFENAISADPDTSGWDTVAVINMNAMFRGATSANPDTSNWNTSAVNWMRNVFEGATSANPDTSNWNTGAVRSMARMFSGASSANPDTSSWDITSVTDMSDIFAGITLPSSAYDAILIGFNSQSVQSDVDFHGGNSIACSEEAKIARDELINIYNWVITDGGTCIIEDIFADDFETE